MGAKSSYALTEYRDGFYIGVWKGILILVLGILVVAGVGLLVYFAAPGNKNFKCSFIDSKQSPQQAEDRNFTLRKCMEFAAAGSSLICDLCPTTTRATKTSLATTSSTQIFTTTEKTEKLNYRIPQYLEPTVYDIELKPNIYTGDPDTFSFDGSVRIELVCRQATNEVYLHMTRLTINNSSLSFGRKGAAGVSPTIDGYSFDQDRQFLILQLSGELDVGKTYFIQMRYTGPITRDMTGLYYSTYRENNITKFMLTSQAGLTEARKIFPCLDEPSLKAQFNVVLLRKPELFSLSNMPIDYNETRSDGWIADVYKPTVKMSTYLLVFIICDFGFKQNITQNDIQFRTFSRRDSVEQLDLALNTGTQILTFFEEYFNVSFPLPKQDMIAIPDFPFGAMENWGLITFRESRLLFQSGVSSQSNKQSIVSVVTHENAHQWFGNIVSPAWWDDAWLNEGFASFIEYLGTDFLYPDWKMFEQFITTDLQQVFLFDGLATSHPLVVPVSTPDEINEAFDDISYWKGSAIIRMMRFFIGEDTFRRGLTRYLTNLKYRAATHDDLWFALANQTLAEGKYLDIKKIMDTWTLQMNYPVITVTRVGESTIRFNQTRFLVDPTSADLGKYTSPFGYQWDVPITYTHSAEQVFNKTSLDVLFLDSSQTELDHDDSTLPSSSNPNSWIIANLMEYGFYRVNYDESNWISLITQLKTNHEAIHTINRAQMINDAWNLAKSGQLSQIIALKTVEYLSKEKDYIPWKSAITELNYVDTMLAESSLYGLFSKFMVTILQDAFDAYGLNKTDSSHMGLFTQATIAGQACAYGIDGCISVAQSMFKKWMDNPQINPIIPELKRTVYCTAIRHGTHREWDFAYNQYQNENVATEKSRILSALGCSSEVWVLSRYLSYSLDPNHVRSQDSVNVIIAVANNPLGRSLAWDYVRGNWDSIFKTFGSSLFSFARLIKGVTSSFNTEFKLSQLTAFKNAQSDLGTGNRAFEQALEKTKSNIKWMEKNEPALREWLDAQNL